MVKDRADEKITNISSTASPETQRKLTGFMSKVKEGAEKTKSEVDKARKEIEKRAGMRNHIDLKLNEVLSIEIFGSIL